jgi:polyisoprenoid-binding protein YceI
MKRITLLTFLLAFTSAVCADNYVIDTRGAHAAITFKFKHIGISWLVGHFKTFSGEFTFDPDNIGATTISVDIHPANIDSNHAERDKHMRGAKYFNVAKFPTAKFDSTKVTAADDGMASIEGDLTLHGVTKNIRFDASVVGQGKDPWGGYRAGFEATYTLNTQDFGMSFPPSNTVELGLFIEGIRR